MVDPDRPLKIEVPNSIAFDFSDYDKHAMGLVLIRALQAQSSLLDKTLPLTWRGDVYSAVWNDTTHNNNEGTGSDAEVHIIEANLLLASILGVKN